MLGQNAYNERLRKDLKKRQKEENDAILAEIEARKSKRDQIIGKPPAAQGGEGGRISQIQHINSMNAETLAVMLAWDLLFFLVNMTFNTDYLKQKNAFNHALKSDLQNHLNLCLPFPEGGQLYHLNGAGNLSDRPLQDGEENAIYALREDGSLNIEHRLTQDEIGNLNEDARARLIAENRAYKDSLFRANQHRVLFYRDPEGHLHNGEHGRPLKVLLNQRYHLQRYRALATDNTQIDPNAPLTEEEYANLNHEEKQAIDKLNDGLNNLDSNRPMTEIEYNQLSKEAKLKIDRANEALVKDNGYYSLNTFPRLVYQKDPITGKYPIVYKTDPYTGKVDAQDWYGKKEEEEGRGYDYNTVPSYAIYANGYVPRPDYTRGLKNAVRNHISAMYGKSALMAYERLEADISEDQHTEQRKNSKLDFDLVNRPRLVPRTS